MANKKIQHEVEAMGLDPTVPHALLGADKRLAHPEVSTRPAPTVAVVVQTNPVTEETKLEEVEPVQEMVSQEIVPPISEELKPDNESATVKQTPKKKGRPATKQQ